MSRGRQIAANKKLVLNMMDGSPMFDHMKGCIPGYPAFQPPPDTLHVVDSFAKYPAVYSDALACKHVLVFHETDVVKLKDTLAAHTNWYFLIPAQFGRPNPKCPLFTANDPFSDVEDFIDAQEIDHPGTRTYFVFTDSDADAVHIKLMM